MTLNNPLRRSGTRLQRQGALWFQQTRNAGETFLEETQTASVSFGRDMKTASTKLVNTSGRSARGFQKALRKEALEWQSLVLKTREAYSASFEQRLESLQSQALSARDSVKPGTIETTFLVAAHDWLSQAQSRVDQRLAQSAPAASKPKASGKPKTAAKPKTAKTPTKKAGAPLRNYDQLTAKDVANRIQRLSAPQVAAVLDYERARKKRATVIRAVEQRLAAAS